jgi:transcription elongation GreA/GreB family factor
LKAQNQLRERFSRMEWMGEALRGMPPEGRREFIARMKDSTGWPALDRKALIGKIIKEFPELESVMSAAPPAPAESRRTLTSDRMYRARQAQYQKLVSIDIPRNSREIAHARSYGDLRENFEYKAAKDMQAVLLRRQAEWEHMLSQVQPSLFENVSCERVGPGTGVRLRFDDGRMETYFILGAWDRDETLRIIASGTRMAAALEGSPAGVRVTLPTEHGTEEGVIEEILPLPAEIREWIAGEEPASAAASTDADA